MAVVTFVFITPFLPLLWNENYLLLLQLANHKTYFCFLTAIGWAAATFVFYGAIAGARGERVGFRECLVKGIRLALPLVLPVFALGLLIGAAFAAHPLAGLVASLFFSLMPITLAVERRGVISALRWSLNRVLDYPWLVSASVLAIGGLGLGVEVVTQLHDDPYIFWPFRLLAEVSRLLAPFVSVLLPCVCVALYVAIRRDKDGIKIEQSLPLPL
jgi:hypothetical protein